MKNLRTPGILVCFGAALALGTMAMHSAPATKAPATPAVPTNAIPKSVFSIPTVAGQARDPFFPSRIIQVETAAAPATNNHPSSIGCLTLKGLSGAPSNPLAMINGRTMARGEDAEIVTDCGRLLVHCVDITTNSAIIEVSGQRQELHLRSDF
ncbi:MAG TPA: hypothetical protein VN873_03410 [Candidatus Angelobacter sp.]|nr:hypothetical protein [Candidatus Angelobacter sp.]